MGYFDYARFISGLNFGFSRGLGQRRAGVSGVGPVTVGEARRASLGSALKYMSGARFFGEN